DVRQAALRPSEHHRANARDPRRVGRRHAAIHGAGSLRRPQERAREAHGDDRRGHARGGAREKPPPALPRGATLPGRTAIARTRAHPGMDYLVAVLLPQLLHGLVFGAALGLLALGLTVIFGLLGVMNFAHGELYMLGAYAGIAVVGVTHSFWVALILAPLLVAALGAVTEIATLRPI